MTAEKAQATGKRRMPALVGFTVALALIAGTGAALQSGLRTWRQVQARYNQLARQAEAPEIETAIRIVEGVNGEPERCVSCHVAAADAPPLDQSPFLKHPDIPHAPADMGCVACHLGDGSATEIESAHGDEAARRILHGTEAESSCATCHSVDQLPLPEEIEDASELIAEFECESCHNGTKSRSLDGAGFRGVPADWVSRHQALAPALVGADDDEIAALSASLAARIGAPHLARGRMVFEQLGCRGCHRVGGVGGWLGPDLSRLGEKRDFGPREGDGDPSTLRVWIRHHLLDPTSDKPVSQMPPLDPDTLEQPTDLDDLVVYLLSLRTPPAPADRLPRNETSASFEPNGRRLYVTFCSACHGYYGTGAELETLGLVAPMIGTRGFLRTVSPRLLLESTLRGRRGRPMPPWGPQGGLTRRQIAKIVGYLGTRKFRIRPFNVLRGTPDINHGRSVYAERCAACHGKSAADTEPTLGRNLLGPRQLRHFDRPLLYKAIVHGWTEQGMPAFANLPSDDTRDLIAFLTTGAREEVPPTKVERHDRNHVEQGREAWRSACAGCHGAHGEGGSAPMLNTSQYLEWASDDYLIANAIDHDRPTDNPEPQTFEPEQRHALLDYLRSWTGDVNPARPSTPASGAIERGQILYQANCTECHGDDARGNTGPALQNPDLLGIVSREFLAMTILEGRAGTPMASFAAKDPPLDSARALDLADYLLSLDRAATQRASARSAMSTIGRRER